MFIRQIGNIVDIEFFIRNDSFPVNFVQSWEKMVINLSVIKKLNFRISRHGNSQDKYVDSDIDK